MTRTTRQALAALVLLASGALVLSAATDKPLAELSKSQLLERARGLKQRNATLKRENQQLKQKLARAQHQLRQLQQQSKRNNAGDKANEAKANDQPAAPDRPNGANQQGDKPRVKGNDFIDGAEAFIKQVGTRRLRHPLVKELNRTRLLEWLNRTFVDRHYGDVITVTDVDIFERDAAGTRFVRIDGKDRLVIDWPGRRVTVQATYHEVADKGERILHVKKGATLPVQGEIDDIDLSVDLAEDPDERDHLEIDVDIQATE